MNEGKVILVRHGTTALNAKSKGDSSERIRGWVDVPLDDDGKAEAERLGKLFTDIHIDRLYSSPLNRAYETAQAISKSTNVKVRKAGALLPWNLGDFNGRAVKDIIPTMNELVKQEHKSVPGGEPFEDCRRRFLTFLKSQLQDAAKNDKTIVCVTHTRDCQIAKAWIANGAPDDLSIDTGVMNNYDKEVTPGGVMELDPKQI